MATVTREQKAIERLRTFARLRGIGGCRVISIGDACECVLCDLDAVAAALSAQPADGEAREHQERLYAMAVDDGETWDLSENDQAACNYGADCIGMLSAVISERDALAAQAPPASDPPGLVAMVDRHIAGLRAAYGREGIDIAMREMGKIRIEALECFRDTLLPASPQAETKGDE